MRAIIQRVNYTSLKIDDQEYSNIGIGLLVLLGITHDDDINDVQWLSNKIVNMRIFSDAFGSMNKSVIDCDGELMIVSQFTLFASTKKGNRPGFTNSAAPQPAKEMYLKFIDVCNDLLPNKVKNGIFGADMKITLLNDGPVTIIMDTKQKE